MRGLILFLSCVLILIYSINGYSITTFQQVFYGPTPFTKIVLYNGTYYIGSTNYIHVLDKNFNLQNSIKIGPVNNSDNIVTMLTIKPPDATDESNVLMFWCGSLNNAMCHINKLGDNDHQDYFNRDYVIERLEDYLNDHPDLNPRGLLSYGVYGHIGSNVNSLSMVVEFPSTNSTEIRYNLFTTSTYDGRNTKHLPALSFYSFGNISGSYYIKPTIMRPSIQYSWIALHEQIAQKYLVYHIKMFEIADYIYIVSIQRSRVSTDNSPFETVVSRLEKHDLTFTSYVETTIQCSSSNMEFNIATDASLADISSELKSRLFVSTEEQGIYLLQGISEDRSPYPTSHSSAVCVLPISQLNSHLDNALRRCHDGKGKLVEWYYNEEKSCTVSQVYNGSRLDTKPDDLLVKARKFRTPLVLTIADNSSMLHVYTIGQNSSAIIGTSGGEILKMSLGSEQFHYRHKISTDDKVSAVQRQTVIHNDTLVFFTDEQLYAFPLRSCQIYTDADQCTSTNDPLNCGWCNGMLCSTEAECHVMETASATRWYNVTTPPEINSVTPKSGGTAGNTLITITGRHFTSLKTNQSVVTVHLNGICEIKSIEFNRIICKTSPTSTIWSGLAVLKRSEVLNGQIFITECDSGNQTFTYEVPSLTRVLPDSGPLYGGTQVTIQGTNLSLGNSLKVLVGGLECKTIRRYFESIICITPDGTSKGLAKLSVEVDGHKYEQDNVIFAYKMNPVVKQQNLRTTKAFISGGTPICIDGDYMDSVHQPKAVFALRNGDYNWRPLREEEQTCEVINPNIICCTIPDFRPYITVQMLDSSKYWTAGITLILDTVEITLPAAHLFPPASVFESLAEFSADEATVSVKGKGFEIFDQQLLNITVNGVPCKVVKVIANEARCAISEKTTPKSGDRLQVKAFYGYLQLDAGSISVRGMEPRSEMINQRPAGSSYILEILLSCIVIALIVGTLIAVVLCYKARKAHKKNPDLESAIMTPLPPGTNLNGNVEMMYNSVYSGSNERPDGTGHQALTNDLLALRRELEKSGVVIDRASLCMGAVIGSGCFGKVYRGALKKRDEQNPENLHHTHIPVAIKTLKGCKQSTEEIRLFVDEAILMRSFNHDNVLQLLGISFDTNNQPLVILPYFAKGDLLSYLRNPRNSVNLLDMLRFSSDIADGMNYLQDVLCVHRDLAARNCMLDDNLRVKVADFGLSRDLEDFNNVIYTSLDLAAKLPVKWMAPESLESRVYSSKSDVWSFGVTLWEIFTKGTSPYTNVDNREILKYLKNGGRLQKPAQCPHVIYEWMLSCWLTNPEDRPVFNVLLSNLQTYYTNSLQHLHQFKGNRDAFRSTSGDSGNHSDTASVYSHEEDYLVPNTGSTLV